MQDKKLLIIVLVVVVAIVGIISVAILTAGPTDVIEDVDASSASYNLKYSYIKSSTYYLQWNDGSRDDLYLPSFNGKLEAVLNTTDIPQSNSLSFEEIMNDYQNNNGAEYNATVDLNCTAYDKDGNVINTVYTYDGETYSLVDLLADSEKISYKDGILTITTKVKDTGKLSINPLSKELEKIDHILCEVHIYNSMYPPNSYGENEAKDSDYYSYILRFTIESKDIKIKNS